MAVPFIVILPGLLGLVVLTNANGSHMQLVGENVVKDCARSASGGAPVNASLCSTDLATTAVLPATQQAVLAGTGDVQLHSYNEVLPLMMVRYLGPGLLGLGITALIAGFMSGMAGNVSAFTAIFTYDIYQPHIVKHARDEHYVLVGRIVTIAGVVISIGAAYAVRNAPGIMDYVQALFSFFISPLLGVVLLGMFWKRATKAGGFWGLLIGTLTSIGLWAWVYFYPPALRYVALSPDAKGMAENMYRALWSVSTAVGVNVIVSLFTKPKPLSELASVVYGVTPLPTEEPVPLYKNEWFWTAIAIVIFFALNIYFW